MPSINDTKHEEAVTASWEATRGAVSGAVKWGVASALLGGIGYVVSPMYRGLTIQFKVYVLPPSILPHSGGYFTPVYTLLSLLLSYIMEVRRTWECETVAVCHGR